MNNYKVSVTIPVYNTSKFLIDCLESLSNQTMKDIEFILVDDGSTDGSGKICDEYVTKDPRFKVVHQKNGGLASARQTGLELATGEYIIVCDSDDWVDSQIYEKLYNKAKEEDADIVVCGYISEYGDGKSIKKQVIFKENRGIVDNFDFLSRGAGSSWIKLIRKSLFEKTKTFYQPNINLSEDILIFYKLMKGDPKVVQIEENLYHYRRAYGGQSYTNDIKMSHIHQLKFTYEWLKRNYTGKQYETILRQQAINIAFAYLRSKDIDTEDMRFFLRTELPWHLICSGNISLKKIFVYLQKIVPVRISKFLLKTIYPYIYK